MAFQITDSENNIISLGDINKMVSDFWNKPVENDTYVNPTPVYVKPEGLSEMKAITSHVLYKMSNCVNWHDAIDFLIHNSTSEYPSWNSIQHDITSGILKEILSKKDFLIQTKRNVFNIDSPKLKKVDFERYYKPYLMLLKHFNKLGWKAQKI